MTRLWLAGTGLMLITTLLAPASAEARLGDRYTRFERSALIQGDDLFRYEGRVGARFRFGPARSNVLGNPLLYVDTQDGFIVQQILVLNFPRRKSDLRRAEKLLALFWQDVGLRSADTERAWQGWRETLSTGKAAQKPLGPEDAWTLDVFVSTELARVLVAVGYKPTALEPGAQPEGALP